MSTDTKIERFFCNGCRQKTKHFVRANHVTTEHGDRDGTSFTQEMAIVECCGCENLAFSKRTHFSEHVDLGYHPETGDPQIFPLWDEAIYPPVTYRPPPPWFDDLPDPTLVQISQEIYKSLQSESLYLATFGSRTLIDRLIVLTVGDQRTFENGLTALIDEGKISMQERDILKPVIQAGHAAAHRGWVPTQDQFKTMLDTVEGLIHRLLVLPKLTEELEEAVPGRKNATKGSGGTFVDIEQKIASAPQIVRKIFDELKAKLMSFGDDVAVYPQKHYVAFRRNRNFASVQVYNRNKQIRAYLNVDPDTIDLARNGVRDVRQIGHYGTGDLELTIKATKEIAMFAELLEKSYQNS